MKNIPNAIMEPPGLMGSIAKHVYENSFIPNKYTAYASALGFMSMLVGDRYRTPDGVTGGLYVALIGATGSGKDIAFTSIPDMIDDIVDYADEEDHLMKELMLCTISKASSKEGIENTLMGLNHFPNLLIQLDELGRFTQDYTRGRSEKAAALATMLTEQYGKNRYVARKLAGDKNGEAKIKKNMSISCIAGTNFESLKNGIMLDQVHDGFLNRFLFFNIDLTLEKSIRGLTKVPLDSMVVKRIKKLVKKRRVRVMVRYDDDADELYWRRDNEIRSSRTTGLHRAFRIRTVLHAKKIAMLMAIAEDMKHPIIDGTIAMHSLSVAEHSAFTMVNMLEENIIDTNTERVVDRLHSLCKEYVGKTSAMNISVLHKCKSFTEAPAAVKRNFLDVLRQKYGYSVVKIDTGNLGRKPEVIINGITDEIRVIYTSRNKKVKKIRVNARVVG